MGWARPAVLALLVLQGTWGIAIGALTAIIGESITPGYVPWRYAAGPLLFGATALLAAFAYLRRFSYGRHLAIVVQVALAAGAVVEFVDSGLVTLWLPLAVAVTGIVLVLTDAKKETWT